MYKLVDYLILSVFEGDDNGRIWSSPSEPESRGKRYTPFPRCHHLKFSDKGCCDFAEVTFHKAGVPLFIQEERPFCIGVRAYTPKAAPVYPGGRAYNI